ncbi:MAG: right-handed parallel beta-helix repeat-containing protein, partial [Oscillospiraceae bacterium]|nr:right-handed parallel beta-helix repeat-containing protein [Oscillospiraceae bacterium]
TSPETNDVPAPSPTPNDVLHNVEIDEAVSYTAPTYPDATEVYRVSTVNDFLAALGSNRIIELTPGDYELWKASTYNTEEDTGEFYYWNTEYGLNELVIRNAENLIIRGSGRDHTEFLSESLPSDVLKFENCSRIALEGFTAGHKQQPKRCDGGVIGIYKCADVTMDDLGLYGCGAVGIISRTCDRMVVTNSDIYDCSDYGVSLWETDSARFEYCRFYRIGDRAPDKHGRAVLHMENCKAVEFYVCQLTDSYVYNLITEYLSEGIDLTLLQFENNTALNSMLDFHNSRNPVVMDKCTFKDNTFVNWYGVEQVSAVNRKGESLSPEDLNTENVIIEPENPPRTEVRVSNVDQFLKAIAPNTAIILEAKEYDLSKAKDYGKGSSDYYSWYEGPDGPELYINNVSNFSITGQGQDKTIVSAVPRHANVLNFSACSNIVLKDFTAGHTREPGECSGGVLNFVSSSQISIFGCGLYGCGVYGVTTHRVEQISIAYCDIYECSQGGTRMSDTNGISIKNCTFRDLGGYAMQWDMGCRGIVTEGNTLPQEELNPPDSTDEVPFNLILGTDEISECSGKVGEHIIVEVDYIPTGMSVEWTTDNSKVVTLEPSKLGSQCVLWIKAEGTATITATRGDETRTLHLKAENNPNAESFITSAELRYANSRIAEFTEAVGHDTKLTLHVKPGYPLTNADVKWYSENPSVASVRGDKYGCTITCNGVGETTITCEVLGKTCSVKVYVRNSW